jgi:hypothetical protein
MDQVIDWPATVNVVRGVFAVVEFRQEPKREVDRVMLPSRAACPGEIAASSNPADRHWHANCVASL